MNNTRGHAPADDDERWSIEAVQQFWSANPCDTPKSDSSLKRHEYFLDIEATRYREQPYIATAARFSEFTGKSVLAIGCGVGTDGTQFAKAGADYTGVELNDAAVALASENFRLRGLTGSFQRVNAEALPFPDATFDHVYSFGVIHHTVNPERIVAEFVRVLKPGGTLTAMVYNRTSANYYLQICFIRRIGRVLLKPSWAPRLLATVFRLPLDKLEGHHRNLTRIPNPSHEQWISMNTDGPDCPIARVYSQSEAAELFSSLAPIRSAVHHRSHWSFLGRLLPEGIVAAIGSRWGWHRMVHGVRSSSAQVLSG